MKYIMNGLKHILIRIFIQPLEANGSGIAEVVDFETQKLINR